MKNDDGMSTGGMKHSQSVASGKFLKRKEKYDPKKALEKGKGSISMKNINKKRVFGKKQDQDSEEMSHEDQPVKVETQSKKEVRGTFVNALRKSIVQTEEEPYKANKTVLPPSLA